MGFAVRSWLLSVGCLLLAFDAGDAFAAGQVLRSQVYPGSIVSLPSWVADEGGFCKAEGIECPATPIASGPLALQALAAGSLEVMFTSTDIIMQAASRGNDIVLIVGHSPDNIYELTMRKDLALKEQAYPAVMKQFVGKTVGISARGSAVENQMRALLVGADLDPDSVTYVAVGSPNTAFPAMLSKQIEAAVMWEPFRTLCQLKGICDVAVDMKKGDGPEILKSLNGGFETFAARRDFVSKNKAAIDAFQRAAATGDLQSLVGILAPDGLIGVHLLQIFAFPSGDPAEMARLSDADRQSLSGTTADFQSKAGYQKIQQTRPQTLGYGLTDSPAGQLAWNAELWTGWGDYADHLDVDAYLTHVSIYWFTRTGVSSARHYYEDARSGAGYRDAPNKVPTAVAVFPQDFRTIRTFAERANNIVRYTEFDRGGHFAYTTDPDLVAGDLREFFADLG